MSDGEEVGASDEALPSPQQVVPKVQLLDEDEHSLDKGVWEVMPAMHWWWEIYVTVSLLGFID